MRAPHDQYVVELPQTPKRLYTVQQWTPNILATKNSIHTGFVWAQKWCAPVDANGTYNPEVLLCSFQSTKLFKAVSFFKQHLLTYHLCRGKKLYAIL